MGWRTVVISKGGKLDYQMGYLKIRQEETTRIHLSEISTLLIESTSVSLTSYLLCELINNKINVIFCDGKRNPFSQLIPLCGSFDSSLKLRSQISWSESIKRDAWTMIITEKIQKQAELLSKKDHKKESEMLNTYMNEVKPGDPTNREAHAAKVYFNALFGKDFSRREDTSINAALDYGYSILLSMVNREIVANGCTTQLGIFHDNVFNDYNFGSDIMEPLRPLVDKRVIDMNVEKFEHEEKIKLVDLLNSFVIIKEKREYLSNAIKIYVKSVIDALNEQDLSKIVFYKNINEEETD